MIEDGDAMEADVVEADQQLLRAADALIKKGDKTSLQKLVDSTADYKKENYLSAGWNTFEAALDAAKKVLADESATQEDVDKAKEVLTSAMTALRYKADKSVLEEIIGKAKAMDLTGYSAENVALFNAALAKAEAVMANEELSVYEQPIVDAAVLDLQNAIKALNDEKDNASKPSDPSKPSNPSKPGSGNGNGATGSDKNNGSGSDGKHQATTAGKQNGGKTVNGKNGKATKTGDVTPIIPAAAGVILSMAAIVVVTEKKKKIIKKNQEVEETVIKTENRQDAADLTLELIEHVPESHQNGNILIRNKDLTVCAWEEGYVLWFPALKNIYEIWMEADGSFACIYYRLPMTEEEQDSLFLAIRPVFLFLAQKKGMFVLHSASLLYLEKAWLFSGPSGMGKSTHTALWKKLFDTPFLNGDLNLIGKEGDQFVVYGIPWCGTSEIFTVEKKELGGIVLLEKAPEDKIVSLTKEQKTLRVMQRMISPPWTAGLMKKNLAFAEEIANEKPVYFLRCTKNDTAAEVMHHRITEDELAQEALK